MVIDSAHEEPTSTNGFDMLLDILLDKENNNLKCDVMTQEHDAKQEQKERPDITVFEGPLQRNETRDSLCDVHLAENIMRNTAAKTDENSITLHEPNIETTEDGDGDDSSTITNYSHSEPRVHNLNVVQMLSYKSAAGIFIMEMIHFIKNENVYSYDNMRINLRHLLELLTIEDDVVKEACTIINIPKLTQTVKTCIQNCTDSGKYHEILLLIEDIERITNEQI
jgi:hypothetical protein